ncbi:hypothetical protein ACFQO4_20795 [Saliphagus sp. GCM10025334]
MRAETADDLEVWNVFDIPPIGEMNNVAPDNDYVPTPDGQVRCYYNTELMRSLHSERFSITFDNEPGEPYAFVFQAPISMWPDGEPHKPSLETMLTEETIPIVEVDVDVDDPNVRVFEPADEVTWEFEICLETTPYEVDDE